MKKALTLEEQIDLLRCRGMIFEDEKKAKEVLLDIGFYRLGFYFFPFEKSFPKLTNRTHTFMEGTTFNSVVQLYYFDNELRYILMKYLNRIEVNIRTYITYIVSNRYPDSPTWFIDSVVINNPDIKKFEASVYKTIRENPVIKRHHKKYISDRFAPAWKTIEFMTFGNICNLYFNLTDEELQKEIAKYYGCNTKWIFVNYLNTIRNIRNTCAHGACLYNIKLPIVIRQGSFTHIKR